MNPNDNLNDMTVKDLRLLASQHQIPGRSRLDKQDLIAALNAILLQAQNQEAEQVAETTPAAEAKTTDKPKAADKPKRRRDRKSSPEVLDPAAVAALAEPQASSASDDSDGDAEDDETDQGQPGDESSGEEPGRKKRRRRRRRRRKGGDRDGERDGEQGSDDDGQADGQPSADSEAPSAPVEDSAADEPTETATEPADEEAPSADEPVAAEKPARRERDRDRDRGRRSRGDRGDKREQDERGDDKRSENKRSSDSQDDEADRRDRRSLPPRPSLDGTHADIGPMHERLVELASGLVGLCDPDTPSWAQAHLSELLAKVGLHPTPCSGEPHPDFHEVVGYEPASDQPAGHIAVIVRPGFSIRGDRNGRLFPIRKAQVKVAGEARSDDDQTADDDDQEPSAIADEPQAEATAAEPARQSKAPEAVATSEPADEPEAAPAAIADDAVEAPAASADTDEETDAAAVEHDSPAPERHDRHERRERRGQRERGARQHQTPVQRQDLAEPLPLKMQDASELDARPKAEGFRELGLNDQLLADLHDMGFVAPTPIQAAAIAPAIAGKDLIGQAQTGTGKTAAFVLPILQRLYELEQDGTAALVLCPTRELARQCHENFVKLAGQSAARAALIYGGVSMRDQLTALDCKPHVIIGTPGRIIDHMRQHNIDCSQLSLAVLDEADQMLDIGFLPDIEYILKHTNPNRQTLLFSATMPEEIKKLCAGYQKQPEHIHVAPERVTTDHVDQAFIACDRNKKTALLAHYMDTQEPEKLVVFCKTKAQVDRVAAILKKKNFKAAAIHGDLPQAKRERTLKDFRDGKLTCMIATNVAARGLDIPTVSHVINYDIPEYAEDYVHRIGRTGRMGGCDGFARTFITPEDGQFLLEIEKLIGMELPEEEVEGITASTVTEVKRSIADIQVRGPRLLRPLIGGIRLGRRRR